MDQTQIQENQDSSGEKKSVSSSLFLPNVAKKTGP